MGTDFKSSKTKENLMRAFAGESQARNRYTHAQHQAEQQKLFVLADLFKFTANQEKEHAMIFYNHLKECGGETISIDGGYPVDISSDTAELLKMANHNETQESDDVYPAFAEIARQEGFSKVAQDFTNIAKIEKYHGERFASFANLMEQNKLFSSDTTETWYCLHCGYIVEGTQAPEICPVCSSPQGYYIRLNMTPWKAQ
ncbi:MAG: rubrerythrin [Oscillospiraceae bacterium]